MAPDARQAETYLVLGAGKQHHQRPVEQHRHQGMDQHVDNVESRGPAAMLLPVPTESQDRQWPVAEMLRGRQPHRLTWLPSEKKKTK
jgi:hypothetical protein